MLDRVRKSFKFQNSSKQQQQQTIMFILCNKNKKQQTANKMMMMTDKCTIVGLGAVVLVCCLAAIAQAQYSTYDSDSNSDSDENPILAKAELGKLVRNSAKHNRNNINTNQQYQQQLAAATRNLYNRQQPMQYAPTHNRRQFGNAAELNGYGPMMGATNARGAGGYTMNNNNDANDDEGSNAYGPNFNSNSNSNNNDDDDGEGSSAEGGAQPIGLNQAASGYPGMGQSDDASGAAGFNFGGISGYGPSADGAEFGPSGDAFSGDGRRHKSASSPSGSRGYGSDDELAGALQYGPNSAINAGGDGEEDSRSGYAPEGQNDNDNDDE